MTGADLDPLCLPLEPLLGTWRGSGAGDYPTIDPFAYVEELSFRHVGKPFVAMAQATRDAVTDEPRHSEAGFLRPQPSGVVELVIAQPSGILESLAGPLIVTPDGLELDLSSLDVIGSASAKSVTATRRRLLVERDRLISEMWMAAVGQPLTHHLRAELVRVP